MMDIESKRRILQAVEHRRAERRRFLRYAGTATAMAGGLSLLAACDDDDDGDVSLDDIADVPDSDEE